MNNFTRDEILIAINKLEKNRIFHLDEDKSVIYTDNLPPIDENIIIGKINEERNNKPMNELRKLRNDRLLESDKYMIIDYPINDEKRDEFKLYRIALRNLPIELQGQQLDINNLNQYLPVKPSL
jgi:hypothetical protein